MILKQTRGILSSGDGLALDLPFAETKSLTALVGPTPVLTRASTATFVDSNGLIQTAAVNEPRFDHDPVTLASKGLLIEESRTNLITGSNAFNTWTTGNCTFAASSVVTPEGTADAWKIVEDSLTATHLITRPFTPVSGTTYTASVWIKSAENGFAFLGLSGGGFPATFISVNLSTGSVSTALGTPIGAKSVSHSNGWWRVSFSLASTASSSSNIDIRLSRDGNWANRSYLGNGVNGMYVYGAQNEAGSFATSYIPTTTSALARSADVCSITGANFTEMYNQPEGTLFGSGIVDTVGVGLLFPFFLSFTDGTANNRIILGSTNSGNAAVRPIIFNSGSTIYTQSIGTVSAGQSRKVALAYKESDYRAAANSQLATAGTTGSPPSGLNRADINSNFFVGTIKSIRYYKKRLPNAKLQALTA